MDFEAGLGFGILVMMVSVLTGGFYISELPTWLYWIKYLSPLTQAYALLLRLEFNSNERFV